MNNVNKITLKQYFNFTKLREEALIKIFYSATEVLMKIILMEISLRIIDIIIIIFN